MSSKSPKVVSVVYTLCNQSHYNNAELRFSLRSIDKYLSNIANVVIVGHNPPGFKNFDHIPARDSESIPDINIFNKLVLACQSDKVTDDFLFMNDDHFLFDYFDASEFPNFYCNSLKHYLERTKIRGGYFGRVQNVARKYPDGKFFDVHTPIMYNKEKFLALRDHFDFEKGMVIKSLYGNEWNVDNPIEITDCKCIEPPLRSVKIMSTFPRVKASVFRYIEDKLPFTCKYETFDSL